MGKYPPPTTLADWLALPARSKQELMALGMALWDEPDRKADDTLFERWPCPFPLLLFPGTWFDAVPEGLLVVDLQGRPRLWSKDSLDRDTRYGCLAYGVLAMGKE